MDPLHTECLLSGNPRFLSPPQTLVHSSGLSNSFVNKLCLVYSLVRLGYGYAYINNSTHKSSFIRSAFWWAGNFTCFYGLWQAGKSYNGGLWWRVSTRSLQRGHLDWAWYSYIRTPLYTSYTSYSVLSAKVTSKSTYTGPECATCRTVNASMIPAQIMSIPSVKVECNLSETWAWADVACTLLSARVSDLVRFVQFL